MGMEPLGVTLGKHDHLFLCEQIMCETTKDGLEVAIAHHLVNSNAGSTGGNSGHIEVPTGEVAINFMSENVRSIRDCPLSSSGREYDLVAAGDEAGDGFGCRLGQALLDDMV